MTGTEIDSGAAGNPGVDVPAPPRRLFASLAVFSFVVSGSYAALGGALLSNQFDDIDPAHKVQDLAIVASGAFVVAVFVQPIVGALSDRTRTRLGRRAPWMIGGAVLATVALAIQGHALTLTGVLICWIVATVGLNTLLAPYSAVLPDRVPVLRRGFGSAMIGLGIMLGLAVFTVVATLLSNQLPIAFTSFGIAILVVTVFFVLVNRDRSSVADARLAFSWRVFLSGFWVNPRKNPDFAWAFTARFLFVLGYYAIFAFELYVFTDYLGLSRAAGNADLAILNLLVVGGALLAVFVGGPLSDRLQRRKPFVYAASVAMALGLISPVISKSVGGVAVMAALIGIGFGLYQACDTALMTQVLPNAKDAAGKDLGILNLANAVPQAAAPLVGGLLITVTGGYTAVFLVGAVIVLLGGLALVPVKRVR